MEAWYKHCDQLIETFFVTIEYMDIYPEKKDRGVKKIIETTTNPHYVTMFNNMCGVQTGLSKRPKERKNHLTVWNLKKKQWEYICLDHIIRLSFPLFDKNTINFHITPMDVLLEKHGECFNWKQYIKQTIDRFNEKEIDDIVCDKPTFEYMIKKIGLTVEEFATLDDDSFLKRAADKWMSIIREYRDSALKELDQLEDETKQSGDYDESDIQDINTIKQMFRDIPQETDLTQYKTIEDLTGFWPSILLPHPFMRSVK